MRTGCLSILMFLLLLLRFLLINTLKKKDGLHWYRILLGHWYRVLLGTTRIVLALKKRGNLASPPPGAEVCAPASSQVSGWAAGSADPPSDAGSRSATSATNVNPTLIFAPRPQALLRDRKVYYKTTTNRGKRWLWPTAADAETFLKTECVCLCNCVCQSKRGKN